jgi:glutamate formiminotransferase/formiminotetrahydrofolate cyclodeaminase
MNLTNFHATPVARVVEMIRREALRYGVSVHHSELVGLIPQSALVDAAVWYLQLDQFEPDQILESKLNISTPDNQPTVQSTSNDFLDDLAAGTAAPGGGAASAYSGAAAAALVSMVSRLTIGKKKYAAVEAQMQAVLEESEKLRADLSRAVQRDSAAFEKVMQAYKLPKGTPQQEQNRKSAIEEATWEATLIPLEVCRQAVDVLSLAKQVIAAGNLNAISDGATGAALARAVLKGAGLNVRINLKSLPLDDRYQKTLDQLSAFEERADKLEAQIQKIVEERTA